MRRTRLLRHATLLAAPSLLAMAFLPGCQTTRTEGVEVNVAGPQLHPASDDNWGGGASNSGGGGGLWSGGMGLSASGGAIWSGGGGSWSGGGSNWSGGGGNWSGGGFWFAGGAPVGQWGGGGGLWSGGGGAWSGGGGAWSGGGSWWSGGGGNWSGGGGWWSGGGGTWSGGQWQSLGGGGNWSGGGGNWSGGGGLWSGGYATEFPLVGASGARPWTLRGIPQPSYNPASPPQMSGAQDTTACPAGQVRLGGFAYPVDVDNWRGVVALGFNKKLCVPTPAVSASDGTAGGLTVNSVSSNTALDLAGGYPMVGDLGSVGKDAVAMKTLVGFGTSNVATQFGGALCAAIGTHAAAKRSCGVGVAFTDPNTEKDGSTSQRGVVVKAAQNNDVRFKTPFGRNQGVGLYTNNENEMEGYASAALHKHTSLTVPTSSSGIDAWNNANTGATLSFKGSDFTSLPLSANVAAEAAKLKDDVNRSVGITASPAVNTLNMSPLDYNQAQTSDTNQSLAMAQGDVYALNLHSVAAQMSPLYGSGAGRWFFHDPADVNAANLPLLDVSSVFQGSMQVLTGQLSGQPASNPSLSNPFLSTLRFRYADWRPEPSGGTLYIDKAGQGPSTVTSDADKQARLAAAFVVPKDPQNIAAGMEHTCALTSAGGGVKCWGENQYGQLGDGSTSWTVNPVQVPGLTEGVTAIVGGSYHTCALLSDGTVKCWGLNTYGQLGDGTNNNQRNSPTAVPGLSGVTALVGGGDAHTCALLSNGTVKCWGQNDRGQLGDGSTTPRSSPTAVPSLSGVTSLAAGFAHNCALVAGGTVKCWGWNGLGQLGDGTTTTPRLSPAAVPGLSGVTSLAAATYHTCAVLSGGSVKCWGTNWDGQLGDGTTTQRLSPTAVSGLSGVAALAANGSHTCALLSGGTVKCWGANAAGAVGDGTITSPRPSPTAVPNLSGVAALVAGWGHTCARLTSGDLRCWGGTYGLVSTAVGAANPTTFQGLQGVPTGPGSLAAGRGYACAVRSNNELYCWGRNGLGQFGNGSYASSAGPTLSSNLGSATTSMAAGFYHTCAVLSGGTVKCWGDNSSGQLGDGTGVSHSSPTAVPGLTGVTQVASGPNHICAVISDGTVKCWGDNLDGQLGDGTTNQKNSPTQVPGLSGVTAIATGRGHTCALISGGTVKCWGDNYYGEVGDGTQTDRLSPTAVPSLTGVTALAANGSHTCALISGGTVKCWGWNYYGQLGDGTQSTRLSPTAVSNLTGVTALGAGGGWSYGHTCAVISGGAVKCWGYNANGQVGDGTLSTRLSPTTVSGLSGATALVGGELHSCARLSSGDVKCWGERGASGTGAGSSVVSATSVGNISNAWTNNFGIMQSQGTVLVERFATSGQIGGHVTPVVQSMRRTSDGTQSLMLTYDPLAAASALFIEQYDAHIAACNNSLGTVTLTGGVYSTTMTEADELSGQKIWACATTAARDNYIAGMQSALASARQYLFGRTDGCLKSTETIAGLACATTLVDTTKWNPVYELVVPDYASSEFSNATTGYIKAISTAASSYNAALDTSVGSRYERTVQLVGAKKFTAANHALVTSQVVRPGNYGMTCVSGEGFAPQGVSTSVCGDGICTAGETGASCAQDCYVCVAESNTDFCARYGKNCGSVTANDNCGTPRTVSNCGACTSPQTCGGGAVANVCGGGTASIVTNGGFEGSASPWVVSGAATWNASGASPYAGSGNATLVNGIDNSSGAVYQTVTLPAGSTARTLSFYLSVSTNDGTTTAYDKLYIDLQNSSGTQLTTLTPTTTASSTTAATTYAYSNKNMTATPSTYVQKTLAIPTMYNGQSVRVQFRGTGDSSMATTFRVDQVSVQ